MFPLPSVPKDRIPGTKPKWRIRGTAVAASWSLTAGWIAFEILDPPHRIEDVLWRGSVALALTALSSCLLIIWCICRTLVEPINDQQYAMRMGYCQGYADGAETKMARVYTLPAARTETHHSNGTR